MSSLPHIWAALPLLLKALAVASPILYIIALYITFIEKREDQSE